jgi:hypothetical protein
VIWRLCNKATAAIALYYALLLGQWLLQRHIDLTLVDDPAWWVLEVSIDFGMVVLCVFLFLLCVYEMIHRPLRVAVRQLVRYCWVEFAVWTLKRAAVRTHDASGREIWQVDRRISR